MRQCCNAVDHLERSADRAILETMVPRPERTPARLVIRSQLE